MMHPPTAALPRTPSAPTRPPLSERVRAYFEAVGKEASTRMELAKRAYTLELQWQLARAAGAPKIAESETARVAAVALPVEGRLPLLIQEGISVIGDVSLRLSEGCVTLQGPQGSQTFYSNECIQISGQKYVLKVFPASRVGERQGLKGAL